MFHFTIILTDTVILADGDGAQTWTLTIQDTVTGKTCNAVWTNEQFTAALALANGAGEENYNGYDVSALYAIAEPLFANMPKECRFIP